MSATLLAPGRLDIACGQNKKRGFMGIDIAPGSDIVHDLFDFPWPIRSDSVSEIECNHFVEHIPHWMPGWGKDGWWLFFEEVYRIATARCLITIRHPHSMSPRADYDPTHTRRIHEATWYYLDARWREQEGLDHYDTSCDFEVTLMNAIGTSSFVKGLSAEGQALARVHYWSAIEDLEVHLVPRKS